jgi:putative flippase GtrA
MTRGSCHPPPSIVPDAGPESATRSSGLSLMQRVSPTLRQFAKFALVGGSGVLVNLAVFNLTLLILSGRSHPATDYIANGLGFIVSVATNYYLNRRWTFRSDGSIGREFPKFLTVSVAAYALNVAVFGLCHTKFGLASNPSQLIAIAFVMPFNYVMNKLWSFR